MTLKLCEKRQTGNRLLMGNDKQLFQNLRCYYEENKQLIISIPCNFRGIIVFLTLCHACHNYHSDMASVQKAAQ